MCIRCKTCALSLQVDFINKGQLHGSKGITMENSLKIGLIKESFFILEGSIEVGEGTHHYILYEVGEW
jgi:hypothetical protein